MYQLRRLIPPFKKPIPSPSLGIWRQSSFKLRKYPFLWNYALYWETSQLSTATAHWFLLLASSLDVESRKEHCYNPNKKKPENLKQKIITFLQPIRKLSKKENKTTNKEKENYPSSLKSKKKTGTPQTWCEHRLTGSSAVEERDPLQVEKQHSTKIIYELLKNGMKI